MKIQRIMTRSPVALARMALQASRRGLPAYSTKFSRKDFTQPQLFALLALRQFFRTDYRGVVGIVSDMPELQRLLGLTRLPHFTTLQKAHERLLSQGLSSDSWQGRSASLVGRDESKKNRKPPSTPRGWKATTSAVTSWSAPAG